MSTEAWREIERLFHAARELEPSEYAAFAAAQCGGDAAIEAELLGLLRADAAGDRFIETPAGRVTVPQDAAPERLGAYRIIRRIGRGGMGDVFLGRRDDDHYEQDVALKVIRGAWAGAELVARFRRERQILAGLDHPNIARLLDGGAAPDGSPYLVMEFVDGEPIDGYARTRSLGVNARLALMRSVCEALAFAHRNLVVHRDIKPGNILVTPAGQTKLLDFGIAKLLSDAPEPVDATATAARMMTLEYASPEHVRGRPVTTASDVYSLGVVLYRLLTGESPYRVNADSLDEITRAICEIEPVRPSAVAPNLGLAINADIDAIVLKALRKEPERRYQSMEQLIADLDRFEHGQPVAARESTWRYRASKFLSRHRVAALASLLAVSAAAAGISSIVTERRRAERRFNDVRTLAHAVVFDYHDAIEKLPGSTPVRERLVRDALTYLDSLAADASGDRSLQRELAMAYQKIGDIQGNAYYANLGDSQQALVSFRKSLALREALVAAAPDETDVVELAKGHDRLGDILWAQNDLTGALGHFTRSVAALDGIRAADSADIGRRLDVAAGHEKIADILGNPGFANLGDNKGALEHYRRSLAIRESAATLAPGNRDVQSALFGSNHRIGGALRVAGDSAGAIAHVEKALAIQQALYTSDPTASQHRILAIAYSRTADELDAAGRVNDARDYTMKAMTVFQELFDKDGTNTRAHRELAVMKRKVARFSLKAGDPRSALLLFTEANHLTEALVARDPANSEWKRDRVVGFKGTADTLALLDRPAEALVEYRRAITASETLLSGAPDNAQARGDLAGAAAAMGTLMSKTGDKAGAVKSLQRGVDEWRSLEKRGALAPADKSRLADAVRALGSISR